MEDFNLDMYNMLFSQQNATQNTNMNATMNANMNTMAERSNNSSTNLQQPKTAFPAQTPIGMAYIPFQMWEKPYDDVVGMSRGTIFPSLDKPFIGEEAVNNGRQR